MMRVTVDLPGPLAELPEFSRRAEDLGYDVLVANETAFEPLLRLGVTAMETERASLSTAVALAFPRAPYIMAQQAWEVQRASHGRLVLGLGTQVKGNMERRFSVPWAPPGPRLRDYVNCIRAIWASWQHGDPPAFESEHYRFQRMNPAANPGPIEHPDIPVVLAAMNPYNARLAGEVGDGIVTHAFTTERYTREVLLPAVFEGARRAGRPLAGLHVRGGGFIATGQTQGEVEERREWVRSRVAYYASTRSYHRLMALHGWEDLGMELHRLSLDSRWDEMTALIPDDVLEAFVIAGTWDELPALAEARYGGLATEIAFEADPRNEDDAEAIGEVVRRLRAIAPFSGDGAVGSNVSAPAS